MQTTIKVADEQVVLDSDLMKFNEATLSNYLENEGSWYDYYGQKLATCEYLMQRYELEYEVLYSEKFKEYKEEGASDKLAEAKSKCHQDVENAKTMFLASKHNVRLLQQHLRAWDKNHDNAMSRGHFLRKEMDKLSPTVWNPNSRYDGPVSGSGFRSDNSYLEKGVEDVVKDAMDQLDNNNT